MQVSGFSAASECLVAAPAPKLPSARRTAHKPRLGEWQPAPGVGWQHGPIPKPPEGLSPESRNAWTLWFSGHVAAHWSPADVPMLGILIRLFDLVRAGAATAAMRTEMRLLLDNFGLTPKGQQDRRWLPPVIQPEAAPTTRPSRYAHLRTIDPEDAS